MSWRESELELLGGINDGQVEIVFRHVGVITSDLCRVVKREGEPWEEEDCAPLSGPTRWAYGLIFGLKWRSIEPVFALRSTVKKGHAIYFFHGAGRRSEGGTRDRVLVMADASGDGRDVTTLTIRAENFAQLRKSLAMAWKVLADDVREREHGSPHP